MTTGDKIKELRRAHGYTQEELGEKLGIQRAAVQKYEKGTVRNIKRDTLLRLAQVLDTTPEYLLGWSGLPQNMTLSNDAPTVQIPVIGRVAAGMSCFADANIVDYETIPAADISQSETHAFLRVVGDSMYPVFMEGDMVLVRVQSSVDSGEYGVVTVDNEDGVIKRIVYGADFIELQSINPMYPPRRFEGEEISRIRVFGKVKEVKRKF